MKAFVKKIVPSVLLLLGLVVPLVGFWFATIVLGQAMINAIMSIILAVTFGIVGIYIWRLQSKYYQDYERTTQSAEIRYYIRKMHDYTVRYWASTFIQVLFTFTIGVVGVLFGGFVISPENASFYLALLIGILGYGFSYLFFGFFPCKERVDNALERAS